MDKFKRIANIAVWVAAAIMAGYLFITDYMQGNPFPVDQPVQTEQVRYL